MQIWSRVSAVFQTNVRIRTKCDLSYFEHGMIVGARQGDLSISYTADLLRFYRTCWIKFRYMKGTKNKQQLEPAAKIIMIIIIIIIHK